MSRGLRGTEFQEAFFDELYDSSRTHPETIRRVKRAAMSEQALFVEISLATNAMPRGEGGADVHELETVYVAITEVSRPPVVFVKHGRFVGTPHVLTDGELCVYLDPAREWDPSGGVLAFLDRLFRWFEQAVAGTFDPATALYHPVGGRAHFGQADDVVVCREEFNKDRSVSLAVLSRVNEVRLDLTSIANAPSTDEHEKVLVLQADAPLYAGPGTSVGDLLGKLDEMTAEAGRTAFAHRVTRRRRVHEDEVHLVVLVPNPATTEPYILVGRVTLDQFHPEANAQDLTINWLRLSDERPSIATRRDKDRPVERLYGKDVVVLGCGGLGSWIAEYAARAGVRSLELVDPGMVTGGLLVRQNFTEADVGTHKAEALAARLRAIAPEVVITVSVRTGISERTLEVAKESSGVIFDATVTRAVSSIMDVVARDPDRRAVISQVATDVATGALGLTIVSVPGATSSPLTIDSTSGALVKVDGRYEPYFTFWESREEDELIPALGCSIPTFHGSAADMAAVAAVQVNLVANHRIDSTSGTYLFALPHTGIEPARVFLPWEQPA